MLLGDGNIHVILEFLDERKNSPQVVNSIQMRIPVVRMYIHLFIRIVRCDKINKRAFNCSFLSGSQY
jgi:hypothetical protein